MPLNLSSIHSVGTIHFPLPRRSSAVVLLRKCNQSTSLLADDYRRCQFSYRRPSRFSALCCRNEAAEVNYFQRLGRWLVSVGGDWWSLPSSGGTELTGAAAEEPVTVITALRQIWDLLANDRLIVYVAFGSLAITALSEITMPSVLTASIFAAQSNNQVAFYGNVKLLGILCFISGICSGMRSGSFALADVILVKRVRETLYSTLIFQDVSFFDEETVGNLTSRLGADCQRLSYVIGKDLHLILRNILQGTGALINLLMLSWSLTLSTVVICSVLAAMFLVYGRFQKNAARLTQEFTACANEVAEDTLSQMRTVQIYGTKWMEFGRYKTWLERLASISFRESAAYGVWTSSFVILYRATQVIAVLLGGKSVLTGQMTPEQLTKYILYCEWMIYATWRLVDSLSSLLQSVGASERIFQLMSLARSNLYLTKGNKLQRLVGNIQFKDVSFCYPSRKKKHVLQNIDLSLQPNEVVAIVGPSGCGKSSLINLLLRFYEPEQGQIYLDGFPLNELDIQWLREKIGYVGPGPYIFNTDINSNISYGCFRDVSQDDILLAAKEAGAHDFISSLPNGYETVVHEGLLSGGQKQRLAIARVVLKNPEILILDEATSALDLESEHHIKGLIGRLKTDGRVRTIIVVAHRLKSIENVDKIIVMNGGRIIEMGTHLELVVKNGLYAHLVKLQTDALLTT